jgi:hypothetical protein
MRLFYFVVNFLGNNSSIVIKSKKNNKQIKLIILFIT